MSQLKYRIGDKVKYTDYPEVCTIMVIDKYDDVTLPYYINHLEKWYWASESELSLVEPVITFTECKWEDLQVWDVFCVEGELRYKYSNDFYVDLKGGGCNLLWEDDLVGKLHKVNGVNILSIIQNVIGDAKP